MRLLYTASLFVSMTALTGCQFTQLRTEEAPNPAADTVAVSEPVETVYTAYDPTKDHVSAAERVARSIKYLNVGDREKARDELDMAVAKKPNHKTANRLLEQLDADPVTYLGEDYFHYKVKRGDSLYVIAKKFMNKSLNFYVLARYNDINNPSQLSAGQVIRIPRRT